MIMVTVRELGLGLGFGFGSKEGGRGWADLLVALLVAPHAQLYARVLCTTRFIFTTQNVLFSFTPSPPHIPPSLSDTRVYMPKLPTEYTQTEVDHGLHPARVGVSHSISNLRTD